MYRLRKVATVRLATFFSAYYPSFSFSEVESRRACLGRRTRPILATKALTNFTCLRYEGPGVCYSAEKGGLVRFWKLGVARCV